MSKQASRVKQQPPVLNVKDNIQDIFMYKKAYEVHLRKLSQIRNIRKSNLRVNSLRNFQIQHIKDVKHNNFMYKMNQQASKICGDNLKLFQKLNKQMNVNRANRIQVPESMKAKRSMDMTLSHHKIQREKAISRENDRLKQRIKSSESHINSFKLIEEEKKRQEIRGRIRKFNANSQLKSNRYFSAMSTRDNKQKETSFSCNISNPNNRRNSSSEAGTQLNAQQLKQTKGKKIISFYNPRDVIMNKIQNFGLKYSNYKSVQKEQRPSTTIHIGRKNKKQQIDSERERRHNSFFATQTH